MTVTKRLVAQAQREDDDPWRVSNRLLYDLCRQHPRHVDDAAIVAKVMLIGHAYSAALERGRGDAVGHDISNDRFYTEHVAKALRAPQFDEALDDLSTMTEVNESNVRKVLAAHACLMGLFKKLTGKGKRSLASKYLHFHLPNLFFIYDSRTAVSIRSLTGARHHIQVPQTADRQYAKFVGLALGVRTVVAKRFGAKLDPRQLDRLLIAVFASSGKAPTSTD